MNPHKNAKYNELLKERTPENEEHTLLKWVLLTHAKVPYQIELREINCRISEFFSDTTRETFSSLCIMSYLGKS